STGHRAWRPSAGSRRAAARPARLSRASGLERALRSCPDRLDGRRVARRGRRCRLALGHRRPDRCRSLRLADGLADVPHAGATWYVRTRPGMLGPMSDESEAGPEEEPEPGDVREDILRELALLFPGDRLQRIGDRLALSGDEDFQFIIDLISATFTRGIEFGAI